MPWQLMKWFFGLCGKGSREQVKKTQNSQRHFLGSLVGEQLAEFRFIHLFEFADRLLAQNCWSVHTPQIKRLQQG
jgi:hypothetical protein